MLRRWILGKRKKKRFRKKELDYFVLQDRFNLSIETIIEYGRDAAQRRCEMMGWFEPSIRLIETKEVGNEKHYKFLLCGREYEPRRNE